MEKETLYVPNISCMHCIRRINQALNKVPGVKDVQGDVETKKVTVIYEGTDTMAHVREALEEIGYPAA